MILRSRWWADDAYGEHRLDAPASRILKGGQVPGPLRHGDDPRLGVARVVDDADVGARPRACELDMSQVVARVLGALAGGRPAGAVDPREVPLQVEPVGPAAL